MFTKVLFLAALMVAAAVDLPAQDAPRRYASGQFPVGKIYQESDLDNLIGTALTDLSYLVGRFVYLGSINGLDTCAPYAGPDASGKIIFSRALIRITFFGNAPGGLDLGKVIVATPADPLTLRRVSLSSNGVAILVDVESWSLPSPNP
jgi:hypothetical protein